MLWCVSKGRPLWLISSLCTMCPSRLCLCLLCRTVMAAIHWVALVPGMNTIWPQVCQCESVCVCVWQQSNACVCLSQVYPYSTCFYLCFTRSLYKNAAKNGICIFYLRFHPCWLCVDWSCYVSYLSLNISPCGYELLNVSLSLSSTLWASDAGQSPTFKCQWRLVRWKPSGQHP